MEPCGNPFINYFIDFSLCSAPQFLLFNIPNITLPWKKSVIFSFLLSLMPKKKLIYEKSKSSYKKVIINYKREKKKNQKTSTSVHVDKLLDN